jgi:hypothetical protein
MQLKRILEMLLSSIIAVGVMSVSHSQEKHLIYRNAELIAVGRFETASAKKVGKEWRFVGLLRPKEVLFGPAILGKTIQYTWACSCCRDSPDLNLLTKNDGVWFFNRGRNRSWTSAAPTCANPGYRPLDERTDVLEYIKAHRNMVAR